MTLSVLRRRRGRYVAELDNFDLLPEEQRVALLLRRLSTQLAGRGMNGTGQLG